MPVKALILSGRFQYGVVDDFLQGIADAQRLQGREVIHIDLTLLKNNEQLLAAFNEQLLAGLTQVFSVNGLGVELIPHIPALQRATFYTWLVDHPLHHIDRFYGTAAKILCVDREHLAFLEQCNITATFWPHAVRQEWLQQKPISVREKTGILFPASYIDAGEHLHEVEKYSTELAELLGNSQINTISDILRALGFMLPGQNPLIPLNTATISVLRRCDLYLRSHSRQKVLRECAQQGVALTVIGNGWEKAERYPVHDYIPAEHFTQVLQRIANSKFVFHHSPGFMHGLHERIVCPLALGTGVLTARTPFLNQHYSTDSGVVLYDHLAEVPQLLQQFDDQQYSDMMVYARQSIQERELWQHRLALLN